MTSNESIQMRPLPDTAHEGANTHKDEATHAPSLMGASQEACPPNPEQDAAAPKYPSGIRFWLAVTTLCLGIFLITLVRQARASC
jgi:hypothetical protein